MGMSMAYGIITRHSGKIEVDSEVGNGTTFTLQFPATNEKESLIATPDTEQEINEKNPTSIWNTTRGYKNGSTCETVPKRYRKF